MLNQLRTDSWNQLSYLIGIKIINGNTCLCDSRNWCVNNFGEKIRFIYHFVNRKFSFDRSCVYLYKKNSHCSIRQQFLFLAFFIEAIAREKLPRNRINILWILFVTCRVLWFVVISGSLLCFFFRFFSLLLCTFFSEKIAINSHANRKSTIRTHATTINNIIIKGNSRVM